MVEIVGNQSQVSQLQDWIFTSIMYLPYEGSWEIGVDSESIIVRAGSYDDMHVHNDIN